VLADVGCSNTVFGAEAQQASAHLAAWRDAGIGRYRLEFAHESPQQVLGVTRAFEDALAGLLTSGELASRLRKVAPSGITEGSLKVLAGEVGGGTENKLFIFYRTASSGLRCDDPCCSPYRD